MGRINIELSEELHRRIKSEAALRNERLSDAISRAIALRIQKEGYSGMIVCRPKKSRRKNGTRKHRNR